MKNLTRRSFRRSQISTKSNLNTFHRMETDWDAVIGLQFLKFSPFNSFPSLKVSIFVKSRCRSPDTGLFVVCPPRTNAATNK